MPEKFGTHGLFKPRRNGDAKGAAVGKPSDNVSQVRPGQHGVELLVKVHVLDLFGSLVVFGRGGNQRVVDVRVVHNSVGRFHHLDHTGIHR